MNQKNSLGLNKCFFDLDNPFELFQKWFEEAKKKEINDPNALALGTANKEGIPSVRMVCLLYTSPSPRDRTRSRMPSSA